MDLYRKLSDGKKKGMTSNLSLHLQHTRTKDLEPVSIMMGIEVSQDREDRKLFKNQATYIEKILVRFRMEYAKPTVTHMEKQINTTTSENPTTAMGIPYRKATGSLIYLISGIHPDIAFVKQNFLQHNESPLMEHWTAVKRVFLVHMRT